MTDSEGFNDVQMSQLKKMISSVVVEEVSKIMEKSAAQLESNFDKLRKENASLRCRVTILDNQARSSNVEVIGWPIEPKYDLMKLAGRMASTAGCALDQSDVVSVKRIGKIKEFGERKCQGILIEFINRNVANSFLRKLDELRKGKNGVLDVKDCLRMSG